MGRLPVSVQKFLHSEFTGNRLIPTSSDYVLLRYGTQKVKKRTDTFLACIADILSYERQLKSKNYTDNEEDISIEDFRNILADTITLDKFVTLHNGSVASIFQPPIENIKNVEYEKYRKTDFFKRLNSLGESYDSFLQSTIASYENFQTYLRDPDSIVDYTYLWDVINHNDKLFVEGYDLIIVELFENNEQVGVICPHAYVRNETKIQNKKTILLLKIGEIYSLLYLIRVSNSIVKTVVKETYHVTKIFSYEDTRHPIFKVIRNIRDNMIKYCVAKNPKDTQMKFQHEHNAAHIFNLLKKLMKNTVTIIGRVWNFQGKIVGIIVKKDSPETFMIPCYPSTVRHNIATNNLQHVWINSPKIRNDYSSTFNMLTLVHKETRISCKPSNRVVHKGNIIGIITESYHFVPVKPIINVNIKDALEDKPYLLQGDYINADIELAKALVAPKNKENHYIELESRFFITFRNKIRQLINIFSKNRNIRKDIITVCHDKKLSFKEKLEELQEKLKELGKESFVFGEFTDSVLLNIHTVHLCSETCNENGDTPYCINIDGKCKLKIPRFNLTRKDKGNEEEYYKRLAEELLTHRRIYLYILHPNEYSDFGNDDYLVNGNEIIVNYNNMNVSFFEKFKIRFNSKYVTRNTYETMPSTKEMTIDLNWEDEINI